jgi:hypothetical protein
MRAKPRPTGPRLSCHGFRANEVRLLHLLLGSSRTTSEFAASAALEDSPFVQRHSRGLK